MQWFREATDKGNVDAQYSIGLYENGWGVPQDYGQAMHWFKMAAELMSAAERVDVTN
jgi:TPR repeat protein